MSAPPGDRGQLDFLQQVQRIFDEGEFVATYKFALLIASKQSPGGDRGALIQLLARSAWVRHIRELGAELAARLSPAGFLDDQPAAPQVARWARGRPFRYPSP